MDEIVSRRDEMYPMMDVMDHQERSFLRFATRKVGNSVTRIPQKTTSHEEYCIKCAREEWKKVSKWDSLDFRKFPRATRNVESIGRLLEWENGISLQTSNDPLS